MNILVYGINYYPELIGTAKYTSEMCEWLAEQGNDVNVITAMPYYPDWRVKESYKNRGWFTEIVRKVKVHRCPLYVPSHVTGKSRIIHELSFALSSTLYWISRLFKRYDIVLCIAPPLLTGLGGVLYKVFHNNSLFIYHIQDLQLDAARQLGLIKNKGILSTIGKLEKLILIKADYISSISEGMIRNISLKGIPSEKIISFKNWIDTKKISPEPPDPTIKKRFGVDSFKKVILYSGNIGEKQGLDNIIEVAELLKNSDIVFLIIGDGAFKRKLEESVSLKGLENVKMFPLQPAEILNKILNMADMHLVLQKKAAADLVMPSKLTAILSVGGIAIVAAEKGTTLYDIVESNKIGIVIEPEDLLSLKNSIVENVNRDLVQMKKNARLYAQKNLEKEIIMKQFQSFLQENLKTRIEAK